MIEINDDNFIECVLENEDFSLVVFCASRCNGCHQLIGLLEKIENNYGASFYKYNIDGDYEFAKRYNVMALPTMLAFKCGSPAGQMSGYSDDKKAEEFINECFSKNE